MAQSMELTLRPPEVEMLTLEGVLERIWALAQATDERALLESG